MKLTEPFSPCEMCEGKAEYRWTNGKWSIVLCEKCLAEMNELAGVKK